MVSFNPHPTPHPHHQSTHWIQPIALHYTDLTILTPFPYIYIYIYIYIYMLHKCYKIWKKHRIFHKRWPSHCMNTMYLTKSSGNLLNTVRHLFHFLNSDGSKKQTTFTGCYHNSNRKRKHLLLTSDWLIFVLVNTLQSVPFKHPFLFCQRVEKSTENN
jgi:hypothetical protein